MENRALAIDRILRRAAQPARGDGDNLGFKFFRGVESGAAEHDRHAAANGRVARQARQRIRPRHADLVRVDFQRLADRRRDERFMALSGGCRVDGDIDRAEGVNVQAARLHPCRRRVLRIEQRLEGRIAARWLKAGRDADAREHAVRAQGVAFRHEFIPADMSQRLVDHRVIIAAVVACAAWNEVGELLLADEVAASHFDLVETDRLRDPIDHGLDGVIGRRLAEAPHRFLDRLVGGDGDSVIAHALDAIGTNDGANRLAKLEWRATGIGAGVVERAHLHAVDDAIRIEGDVDIEDTLGAVRVAGAHVFQPVLDEAHGATELAGEMAHQHAVLDAALDAVAAADIDIVMHAHAIHRQAQGAGDLIGVFRHLDRGAHVEHLAPWVPLRENAEGLDGDGGVAAPGDAQRQLMLAGGEMRVDVAPVKYAVEQHVGAMGRVHGRARGRVGFLGVDDEGQGLVFDLDKFGGVLGQRARVGDDGGHPFAHVARCADGERVATDVRRVEPVHQGFAGRREFRAVDDRVDAGHGQRLRGVDGFDDRGGMLGGHERDVQHAFRREVGDVASLADDEAAILAHATIRRDVAEFRGRVHAASPLAGVFEPARRRAASSIASTIWP